MTKIFKEFTIKQLHSLAKWFPQHNTAAFSTQFVKWVILPVSETCLIQTMFDHVWSPDISRLDTAEMFAICGSLARAYLIYGILELRIFGLLFQNSQPVLKLLKLYIWHVATLYVHKATLSRINRVIFYLNLCKFNVPANVKKLQTSVLGGRNSNIWPKFVTVIDQPQFLNYTWKES